jgi:hypothetical protein
VREWDVTAQRVVIMDGLSGCGRAGAWDAAHGRAAESAKADFVIFQRRIHSLLEADGTVLDKIRNRCPSLLRADGTMSGVAPY